MHFCCGYRSLCSSAATSVTIRVNDAFNSTGSTLPTNPKTHSPPVHTGDQEITLKPVSVDVRTQPSVDSFSDQRTVSKSKERSVLWKRRSVDVEHINMKTWSMEHERQWGAIWPLTERDAIFISGHVDYSKPSVLLQTQLYIYSTIPWTTWSKGIVHMVGY